MQPRKMTSRKTGTCTECKGAIEPGDSIYWARGRGAWHANCETARLRHTLCTACNGSGCRWNNAPCPVCDGTGSRKVQDFATQGGHPQAEEVTQ